MQFWFASINSLALAHSKESIVLSSAGLTSDVTAVMMPDGSMPFAERGSKVRYFFLDKFFAPRYSYGSELKQTVG